ncbi:hypothetical protein KKP04_12470 [Rhodomicrobium sp. Az07]|uniref:hypothetical protein n=1 Tax=Rhodomicrobium sp. Az07 TaxID=2839034 RepID=UPI001BEAA100|nr:hypothetical protein [Rhodomicrobium sp. Az07]MBT3071677.1 hypothetical protein [Rhodomicrobium sp. Az07]
MKKIESKEQSERFRQTARELEADETGEAFERAFGKIVPPKTPKPTKEPEPKTKKTRK